ncbi:diacylglycerol kinase [uncultured Jatrophihabitans sp.]|uniref:diacylglycerol kinase n=1 Tax=uncultured Jatrophihabitans sp. TaxID=1610747 RepID=UPI0035CA8FB7
MIKDVALVVNPAAGRGGARDVLRRAVDRLAARGIAVRELCGASPAESRDLAGAAVRAGVDALVVVGGDGMIHLALPAVVGTDTPLGVIPAGTGNDQARTYGWPRKSPESAADIVADGYTRRVDVGVAVTADGTRSYFGSVLASGFDSLVSDRTNRMRWPRGRARYNLAMLAEFANLRPLPCTVTTAEGETIRQDVLLVAVGNTPSYGGGMRICPAADPTDGVFDVTIAGAVSRRRAAAQVPRVYRGTHVHRPQARTLRTTALRIEAPGINAYADGEYLGPLPVDVTLEPQAVSLLVPRASAGG